MEKISAKFKARVLVVDDYFFNQELTKEMLEMMNCEVDVAENGREAISQFESNKYDLIFMDIQMPEVDGYEATKQIRQIEEGKKLHTPIIALTANVMQGDREKCLSAGMDDYISKPIKSKDLEGVLKKFIGA